jgi:hypothetical protein
MSSRNSTRVNSIILHPIGEGFLFENQFYLYAVARTFEYLQGVEVMNRIWDIFITGSRLTST